MGKIKFGKKHKNSNINIKKLVKETKNKNNGRIVSVKKTQKTRSIYVYILCNNQLMEYRVNASRKFNIDDETYVIKSKCCYFKQIHGVYELVSYYVEGNPNPFRLDNTGGNVGLTKEELDGYISGDMFNILIECQEEDKKKYIIQLAGVCTAIAIFQFVARLFWS